MIIPHRDAIMIFSHRDTWLDARRREFCRPPDQVYRYLVDEPSVHRVLVADPWRNLPVDLVRRLQGRRPAPPSSDRETHVRPMSLRLSEPVTLPAMRRRYRAYGRVLERAARRAGLEHPAVVSFNPFAAAFTPMPWASTVVYYARDDWAATDVDQPWRECITAAYAAMRERDLTVCAVSRELADRIAGPGRGIVIPNGIDEALWRQHLPVPRQLADLPRPWGVYAGTVDDRLDVDAVVQLARRGPLRSIHLAGMVADPAIADRLAAEPNIHVMGLLAQRELAATVMAADVCLLTHVSTALTKAMSPLKLYEYLASGASVVSADLPPVRDVDPRVVLVADGAYVPAVERALAQGRATEPDRLAFIDRNSWHRRLAALHEAMFPEAG